MPKTVFDKLNFTHLAPMPMMLQQADSIVRSQLESLKISQ
jgi:hypothetical protein